MARHQCRPWLLGLMRMARRPRVVLVAALCLLALLPSAQAWYRALQLEQAAVQLDRASVIELARRSAERSTLAMLGSRLNARSPVHGDWAQRPPTAFGSLETSRLLVIKPLSIRLDAALVRYERAVRLNQSLGLK